MVTEELSREIQQIQTLTLGASSSDVKQRLGSPLKETVVSDETVWRYGSDVPTYAHYLHFRNSILTMKSVSVFGEKDVLNTYIIQYGSPEKSFLVYSDSSPDSFSTSIHIWSNKGIAVTTYGYKSDSEVIRVQTFQPMKIEEFLEQWGTEAKGKQVHIETVQTFSTVIPTPAAKSGIVTILPSLGLTVGGFVVIFLLVLVIKLHRQNVKAKL